MPRPSKEVEAKVLEEVVHGEASIIKLLESKMKKLGIDLEVFMQHPESSYTMSVLAKLEQAGMGDVVMKKLEEAMNQDKG